jgi:acyl carrier protein
MLTLRAAVEANGVDSLALRSWLSGRLPEYLVPDRVIVVDEFPITANGKLDQAALRPAPVPISPAEPGTAAERDLSRIWSELLGVCYVGLDDDVFSLGANSMTVLAVVGRVNQELGWTLPSHVVYSVRTVRGLAAHAQGSAAIDDPELRRKLERRATLRRKARSRRHEAAE